jgi:hypothetical protein
LIKERKGEEQQNIGKTSHPDFLVTAKGKHGGVMSVIVEVKSHINAISL